MLYSFLAFLQKMLGVAQPCGLATPTFIIEPLLFDAVPQGRPGGRPLGCQWTVWRAPSPACSGGGRHTRYACFPASKRRVYLDLAYSMLYYKIIRRRRTDEMAGGVLPSYSFSSFIWIGKRTSLSISIWKGSVCFTSCARPTTARET